MAEKQDAWQRELREAIDRKRAEALDVRLRHDWAAWGRLCAERDVLQAELDRGPFPIVSDMM